MDLRDVDLNLLVVLDAILDEAHVSRAAERLALSQPATSAALARCRQLFGDELIQRRNAGMEPTAKALALREPLKTFLAATTRLMTPAQAQLSDIRQLLRLVTADHMGLCIAEALLPWFKAHAPGVDLVVHAWSGPVAGLQDLARGHIDLMICPQHTAITEDFRRKPLIEETWRLMMRPGHPYLADPTPDAWLAYPHVVMSGRGDNRGIIDDQLAKRGLTRRVGMVIPNYLVAPRLVAGTDLIVMVPSRCAGDTVNGAVVVVDPPIDLGVLALNMFWHHKRDGDLAVQAVVDVLPSLL